MFCRCSTFEYGSLFYLCVSKALQRHSLYSEPYYNARQRCWWWPSLVSPLLGDSGLCASNTEQGKAPSCAASLLHALPLWTKWKICVCYVLIICVFMFYMCWCIVRIVLMNGYCVFSLMFGECVVARGSIGGLSSAGAPWRAVVCQCLGDRRCWSIETNEYESCLHNYGIYSYVITRLGGLRVQLPLFIE